MADKTYRYKNPWYTAGQPQYGPEFVETSVEPVFYRGAQLFTRPYVGWDVVINDTRMYNRVSEAAAKKAVDRHLADLEGGDT